MENNLILFALPVFIIFILVEIFYGAVVNRNTYKVNDTISSLSQGLISQAVAICTPFFQIGAYELIFRSFGNTSSNTIWQHWYGWLIALLAYDFLDYWLHRVSHQCAFFWGAHVVHHQSQFFNLSTALRQESLYPIVGCFFFFPMALMGIPPYLFAVVSIVVLVYQFWIHTEHIGSLGWFDYIFSSPSNHRVHHAINDEYIDKNFGAILIIWDHMFGTFQKESSKCIYGTKTPLNSWNPFKALGITYWELLNKSYSIKGLVNKLRVFYLGPGWLPVRGLSKENQCSVISNEIYDPLFRKGGHLFAIALFLGGFLFVCFLMLMADDLEFFQKAIGLMISIFILYFASFFMKRGH